MKTYNFDTVELLNFAKTKYRKKELTDEEYFIFNTYCQGNKTYGNMCNVSQLLNKLVDNKEFEKFVLKDIPEENKNKDSLDSKIENKELSKEEIQKEYTKLIIPDIKVKNSEIENFEKFFDDAAMSLSLDILKFDYTNKIENLDDTKTEYDFGAKDKYGDKVVYRDIFYKKSMTNICFNMIYNFINSVDLLKTKVDEMKSEELAADVFNRNDIAISLASKSSNCLKVENADEKYLLLIKYIFAIRITFKDQLYKIFPILTKNQIDYMIKKLSENKLILTKQDMRTRKTTIIPTNKLNSIILKTELKAQNSISGHEYVKNRTRNEYIISLVENAAPDSVEALLKVFKQIPTTMLYKGAERVLLSLIETDSRFGLEYYYDKLIDIQNSLQSTIRNTKKSKDAYILEDLNFVLIPLSERLNKIISKCYYTISSYGKFKDYATISLKSLANNSVYVYDIKVRKKEEYSTETNFKILFLQNVEDYRVSSVCYKTRDVIIYMCSSNFENDVFCDKNDIYFYDDFTRNKFLNKASSIKSRIKDNKSYYYSDTRSKLAKYLSKHFLIK